MADREKVIKGLERCKLYNKLNCDKCPYDYNGRWNGKSECTAELATDALELLKDQETEDIGRGILFLCKTCGYGFDDIFVNDESKYPLVPRYCPNCGRKVKRDDI